MFDRFAGGTMTPRTGIGSVIFALALLAPSAATAQVAGGTIQGTVADGSGAVLPGTTVVVKNVGTAITTEVVTNERGVYRAPNLRPGVYDVSAALHGFSSAARKGLELSVGGELTLDLKLLPGRLTETVTVVTEAPAAATSSPTPGA